MERWMFRAAMDRMEVAITLKPRMGGAARCGSGPVEIQIKRERVLIWEMPGAAAAGPKAREDRGDLVLGVVAAVPRIGGCRRKHTGRRRSRRSGGRSLWRCGDY